MSRKTILSDPAVPGKPDAPEKPTARPRRRDQIQRTAGMAGGSLAFGLQAGRKLQK